MSGFDHLVLATPDLDKAARFYEAMGFRLTPRGHHPFGTDNRLIQLSDRTYIELLAVERPEQVPADGTDDFNFAGFNRDALSERSGMTLLAMRSGDFRADRARFVKAGLTPYPPFSFGREGKTAAGRTVRLAFNLTFLKEDRFDRAGFFTCHHEHPPEAFWAPDFRTSRMGRRVSRKSS